MRKNKEEVLAMVMAGGKGERLYPLTLERTKPSVPFGGKYRIIDFALSNLVNSGIYSTYVLVQYKSQSLIEHIRSAWTKGGFSKHFIGVVPPQMRMQQQWYRGTADSIYQNINLIYDFKPRLVAVFGGDHVYRMNIKDMIDYHIKKKSQLTISTIPVESKYAYQFGIVKVGSDYRVKQFLEKPALPEKETVLASMGNYIFNTDFLMETLENDAKKNTAHDFGKDIVPYSVERQAPVFAYDFSNNRIPSLKKYEAEYYWKDVGTISSYWQANAELLGRQPKLDLDNQDWPIYASNLNCPPAYTVDSDINNSLICEGTRVFASKIKNSIIGRAVTVEEGCSIENSMVMDFTHIDKSSSIKGTIIDRFNTISPKTKIGYNKDSDKEKYCLDSSGITVVRRGSRKAYYF
ncbi:MAG: glucose-1-phosphate adenylyltransferase [Candidatus Omnitrophota bacterium]|nr:MAG: glucose-1-phosphate adenylyltransferase [Candidatus Omnitrophota bacterium]